MLAGNRDYFVVDMIADTAIQTYMNGKPYVPLLTQGKVDTAMKINRDKALREYYNVPTRDGGENQIVKGLKACGVYYFDEESGMPCVDIIDDEGETSTVTVERLMKMFENCEVEIKVNATGGLDGR